MKKLLKLAVNTVTKLYEVETYRNTVEGFNRWLYSHDSVPEYIQFLGDLIPSNCPFQKSLSLDFAPCMINPLYPHLMVLKRYTQHNGDLAYTPFDPRDLLDSEEESQEFNPEEVNADKIN